MAWYDHAIPILRSLTSDSNSPITQTDDQLEDLLIHAAFLLNSFEVDFSITYTINVAIGTISPDPIDSGDNDFVVLMCYKAACMLLSNDAKTAGSSSIIVKDGPSVIDGREAGIRSKALAEKMCREYERMKITYKTSAGMKGHAIVTPFHDGSLVADFNRNPRLR